MSGRNEGIVTSWTSSSSVGSTPKPIGVSRFRISSDKNSRPSNMLTLEVLTGTEMVSRVVPATSSTSPTTSIPPGVISLSRSQNRSTAVTLICQSVPRSNRADASDLKPSLCEVLAIDSGSQQASSNRTELVLSDISVEAPPITPAMPMGSSASLTINPSLG